MVSIDWGIGTTLSKWRDEVTLLNLLEYIAVGWTISVAILLLVYAISHVSSHREFITGILLLLGLFVTSGFVVCTGSSRIR